MSNPDLILPDSKFGKKLTEVATACDTIVEIGTGTGDGSTRCLANALVRPEQRMWTIELDKARRDEAAARYNDPRITFLHGTVLDGDSMPESNAPRDLFKRRELYLGERKAVMAAPNVLKELPKEIDFLLLDGGGWTSVPEFFLLRYRSLIIALDDVREDAGAWKRTRPHRVMRLKGGIGRGAHYWEPIAVELEDRLGWSIFKRTELGLTAQEPKRKWTS